MWLYGYLTGYLAMVATLPNTQLTSNSWKKFFPALFTLCVAFLALLARLIWSEISAQVAEDFL